VGGKAPIKKSGGAEANEVPPVPPLLSLAAHKGRARQGGSSKVQQQTSAFDSQLHSQEITAY